MLNQSYGYGPPPAFNEQDKAYWTKRGFDDHIAKRNLATDEEVTPLQKAWYEDGRTSAARL